MPYIRVAEEEDHARLLYWMLHCFCCRINVGNLSQSNIPPSVDLVCFEYPFRDN